MICSNCQAQNPEGSKFCNECGKQLTANCPNCGSQNPPGAKFCNNCGHALAKSPQPTAEAGQQATLHRFIPQGLMAKLEAARNSRAMEGERRIVTMLFCDVAGSTAAAGQLDPEEWAEIINGAFANMISPVYKYEGTLARLMGDAILAFFGAPIAHEDDPERAVRAGLEIIEGFNPYREQVNRQWGIDFNVRVGINTGLVVVGAVGSDMRMEYSALGDATNLAARMEQTAVPGTVQITEDTHKLIAGLFEFEDVGGIDVKGKDAPVQVYRVLHPKIQPERQRGIEGLDSPLIGRDVEMHTLRGAMIELRRGRGSIISILGEAGLGKSRLVAEFRKEPTPIAGRKADLRWLEGRSLSYETATPYAPFIDIFTEHFGLHDDQKDPEKYAAVRSQIAGLLPGFEEETAPFLASLLGVQPAGEDYEMIRYMEPPQLRGRIFNAVQNYLEHLAAQRPLVLIFEDIHWIDSTSLDLLESLLPLIERASLLILALFRPHRQDPSWRFHETAGRDFSHRYRTIFLSPLDGDNSRQLVVNLLQIEDLPTKVQELILQKSEGNPFYIEEVIRSLLDSGLVVRENGHWRTTREIQYISVPDTLAAVITSRLDRLNEEQKQAVQTASVIGREFGYETLKTVHQSPQPLDDTLTELQRRELVREKSRLPRRVYNFKHVLTQETAYASLLIKRRRELHRKVAECLERNEPDRAGEIARHYLEAGSPERALPYLVEAADRASHVYATLEAIDHYLQALEIMENVENLTLARRIYEGLGRALTLANQIEQALETYQAMFSLARAHQDVPAQVSALNKMALLKGIRQGDFSEAEQYLADAERLARRANDIDGLGEKYMTHCFICTGVADLEGAMDHLNQLEVISRELKQEETLLFGLTHIANTLALMARFDESWTTAQEARELAERLGHQIHLGELFVEALPLYHMREGDLEAARQLAEQGAELLASIGGLLYASVGAWVSGTIARMQGAYEQALRWYERALEYGRAMGYLALEANALSALCATTLEISPRLSDRAIPYQVEAKAKMQQPAGTAFGAAAWLDLGFTALALGSPDEAGQHFQNGLTIPTALMYVLRPLLLVGNALAFLAQGELDEPAALFKEAWDYATERGMRFCYPFITLGEGRLHAALGRREAALESCARSEELALEMGMRPLVWQARVETAALLQAMGLDEEAEEKRDAARKMAEEIAGLFEDDELRARFEERVGR